MILKDKLNILFDEYKNDNENFKIDRYSEHYCIATKITEDKTFLLKV